MTANGWIQILLFFAAVLAVTKPLGVFMHRVMEGQRHVTVEEFQLSRADIRVANLRIDVVFEAPAERTLEVSVFDESQRGRRRALEGLARDGQRLRRLECRLTRAFHHLLQLIQSREDLLLLDVQPCHLVPEFDEIVVISLRSVRTLRHQ